MSWPVTPAGVALWWSRNWLTLAFLGAELAIIIVVTAYSYQKGAASVKPALAVAGGQAAVSSTNDANAKGALTATSERHRVEVTIREIERETGNVVAEARITGDTAAAVAGWTDGITRMRAVGEASPNADPDKRP